ncbi:gamma-glutamyltransferase [Roseospira visakhapatnamensis]|uniref:Gamma-glutamyltranspeptidase/glutathione hydrolase n=1 Tax=Roseospira visakhapatnamensis TaxID=390880 RepID=A0A7W6REP6_9PROT|nr:gamma-glutamyltransferase [Roseospira visakhapatnamensis]MBB4266985.1 gamma-glutamyltranspeptidase/glutathione hydrolase [Roseospira visakhapatnamensis]
MEAAATATGHGGGAVAAGHPDTAGAAAEILADGGTAFDAIVAALGASFAVEPALSSPGGGGFLLAHPVDAAPLVLDFFAQTPGRSAPDPPNPGATLDFHPVLADFGTTTQEFHVGRAAAAVPGMIPGLCAIQRRWGRLPLARLLEPGIRLARQGRPLAPLQAHIMRVIGPIMTLTAEAHACLGDPSDRTRTRPAGTPLPLPLLADCLEALGREGEALFRDGPAARAMADLTADGGLITIEDIRRYQVHERRPLARRFHGARVLTNPPPSSGGALIAYGLALLEGAAGAPAPETLVRVMHQTGLARDAAGLAEGVDDDRAARLLSAAGVAEGRAALAGGARALKTGGTTHVSVIDAAGNAAACTVSNGEGCGHMVPGCGFMLNNMLGEEDLNPAGFFRWRPDTRVSSMMAPTLAECPDGTVIALGSGGSNRIRTALLQVLGPVLAQGSPLAEAVAAPRLHMERGHLDIEGGWEAAVVAALRLAFPDSRAWPERSMFYGGVHAVARHAPTGAVEAVGDSRRGGAALVVPVA